ncbi:saccharopine dehydrogenase family protein [Herpetosiphon giganteus]|uniref:saccharopine dehydrogenase family protein n=1 Tax=Herpetosiphon giganteus TaxID=2029754 RepID=UPI00195C7DB3|nr:saccharopine dehydrogenase [Herpetosiphon giganteus]MBM7842548.1 hypothetical protein [Herpetosiphon giganteus]
MQAIVIVGGYGVVGAQIAQILRQSHGDLPLILAGRNPNQAQALLAELGAHTSAAAVDVLKPNPLAGLQPRAIINAVNDPHDYVLHEAVARGIPLVDITRWTARLQHTLNGLDRAALKAPLVFASHWMAGLASVVAVAATQQLAHTEQLDLHVLFSLKDKAGPNSIEYMQHLTTPFTITEKHQPREVYPYTEPQTITFPNGYRAKTYRFDTPDQWTLPQSTKAASVSARITFDDRLTMGLLLGLARSGVWKLLMHRRFDRLRHSLLYNPGKGAAHELVWQISGRDAAGNPQQLTKTIVDPQGQTHLTAVGAVIQLETMVGLDGSPALDAGIYFPETAPKLAYALERMQQLGVELN